MNLCVPLICVTLACLHVATAAAQKVATRVPATIVLMDSMDHGDAAFVIIRRRGGTPADVVVLRSGATVDQLSEAIRGLLAARYADGDFAPATATFRVRPRARADAPARSAFPWAVRVLSDLHRAEPREIQGVGRARAVEIWLPRQGNARARRRT